MSEDGKIIESWQKNVAPWIDAIRNNEISSRTLVTNDAILKAILAQQPRNVLDIGCGEGWLVRALVNSDIDALGIDVIPEFIEYAQHFGKGRFRLSPYEKITPLNLNEKFDVVVCNFSLLGEEPVNGLFKQIPQLLEKQAVFIVQTIHPGTACGDQSGWRQGSWEGFSEQFRQPAPWYFRTLEAWKSLFAKHQLQLRAIHEPVNPETRAVASIIFVAAVADASEAT